LVRSYVECFISFRMPSGFEILGPRNQHLTRSGPRVLKVWISFLHTYTHTHTLTHTPCFPSAAGHTLIPLSILSATISFCPHSPPFISFSPVFSTSRVVALHGQRYAYVLPGESNHRLVLVRQWWTRGNRRMRGIYRAAYLGISECYILNVIPHEYLSLSLSLSLSFSFTPPYNR